MHINHHRRAAASVALFALRIMGQRTIMALGYRTKDGLKRAGLRGIARNSQDGQARARR